MPSEPTADIGMDRRFIRSPVGRMNEKLEVRVSTTAVNSDLVMMICFGIWTRPPRNRKCKVKVKIYDEEWGVKES